MPQRTLSESEFNAIRDKVLQSLPQGLSESDYQRAVGPRLAQAIGEAESMPAQAEGSSLGRYATGVAQNMNPVTIASGLYQAVRHPIDTVGNIAAQQIDQGRQAVSAAKNGEYSRAIGHGLATALPILGPAAANAGESIASGDVAGGLGQATGILAPFAASKALAVRSANRAAQAPALEAQAAEQVSGQVLAPGNMKYRGDAQRVAPEVLKRGMQGDRLALRAEAQGLMDRSAQAIDDAIMKSGGDTTPIPATPVIRALQDRIDDLTAAGETIEGAAGKVDALKARIAQIERMAAQSKNGDVPFGELRKVRDVNYGVAEEGGAYQRAGQQKLADAAWAAQQTGSAIRETFGASVPDLAAANADFAFARTLDKVLDPAIGRPKNMTPSSGVTGGTRVSAATAGMMTNSRTVAFVLGTVLPWWLERKSSPAWQLADANAKMKLANALKSGDVGKARMLMATWAKYGPKTTSPSEPQPAPALAR